MAYGLLNAGQATKNQAMTGLKQNAEEEQKRNMMNEQMKQGERTQSASMAGTGAAIGTYIMPGWGTAIGAAAGYVFGELL